MERNCFIFLDEARCTGCTNCIKRCPTAAIRVRDGKAKIFPELCINCCECVRICPNHAPIPKADSKESLSNYKYKIALPDPAVFAQFKTKYTPDQILAAIAALGFDGVYEVARAADEVSVAIRQFLEEHRGEGPWISSSCPAVIYLIQLRFPTLTDRILPILPPVEIAAKRAKEEAAALYNVSTEEIGCFYLTPCPAHVAAIHHPYFLEKSNVDGALAISNLYSEIRVKLAKLDKTVSIPAKASPLGLAWGRIGGQTKSLQVENFLSLDGVYNLLGLLEEIELDRFNNNVDFLECQNCQGGSIGGIFTAENPFVARVTLRRMINQLAAKFEPENEEKIRQSYQEGFYNATKRVEPYCVMSLDQDISKAIYLLERSERILRQLPGLDCGACGSPTCRTLAEDIVRGLASETDCMFILREKVQSLAEQMLTLALQVPPETVIQRQIMKVQQELLELAKKTPPPLTRRYKKREE
ncbi:MAG: [Fe-Fe] hydrogenase large subunit C-terminal domain-containing protein [Thermacetogeniaceae bacterium]